MNATLEDIKTSLSVLPESERAELAQYLLDSLDSTEATIREEWIALAKERIARMRAGLVVGIPAEQVLESLQRPRP